MDQILNNIDVLYKRKNNIKQLIKLLESTTKTQYNVQLVGVIYDPKNTYTNFGTYLDRDDVLIIYNENFNQYLNKSDCTIGAGNGFMRQYRSDSNTCIKKAAFSFGIPTGTFHTINDQLTTLYDKTKTYKDIIDDAINQIKNTLNINKQIKYVLWSIDEFGQLGLSTFTENQNKEAAKYITNTIKPLFKTLNFYDTYFTVQNHGVFLDLKNIVEQKPAPQLVSKPAPPTGLKPKPKPTPPQAPKPAKPTSPKPPKCPPSTITCNITDNNNEFPFGTDNISLAILYNLEPTSFNALKSALSNNHYKQKRPHFTLHVINFNQKHPLIHQFINTDTDTWKVTNTFEEAITKSFNKHINNQLILTKNKFTQKGKFYALDYHYDAGMITNFRMAIYDSITKGYNYGCKEIHRQKNNQKTTHFAFCNQPNAPLYAVQDYYFGRENWTPHISILYTNEVKVNISDPNSDINKIIKDKNIRIPETININNPSKLQISVQKPK